MQIKQFAALGVLASFLTACGGDLNISADGVAPVGGVVSDPCASFMDDSGILQAGTFETGTGNCIYSIDFASAGNPVTADITLVDLDEGAHVFFGDLFIGEDFDTITAANAAGIMEGGDGPTLTLEAGATVAMLEDSDFVAIRRGSQIMALGEQDNPITFTSFEDVAGQVGAEEVSTWGGLVIAGFGFLNTCEYLDGFDPADPDTLQMAENSLCSDLLEGTIGQTETHYGGSNADDNSGQMSYVVVKHAGAQIITGNELNGITFGAVGSDTVLNNIEVYSNFDDGIEFFGGGADLQFYLAMYIRDDSIDIDQGYYGTIDNALVIQGGGVGEIFNTGAHCVESDGSSGANLDDNFDQGYVSQATINNLTCIISAKGPGVAGNGDPGAGINVEESHLLTLNRSIVTTAYAVDATENATAALPPGQLPFTNYCFQLEDPMDLENAANGLININTTIFACADISANDSRTADIVLPMGTEFPGGTTGTEFLMAQDNVVFATADDGTTPPDSAGGVGEVGLLNSFYSLPLNQMMIDGTPVALAFTTQLDPTDFIGAVTESDDWTQGWTFGLAEDNRAEDLWFELEPVAPPVP